MKFEADKTYKTRFGNILVVKRTEKTVTVDTGLVFDEKRCKIHERDGVEFIFPYGRYSMAPTASADRRAA